MIIVPNTVISIEHVNTMDNQRCLRICSTTLSSSSGAGLDIPALNNLHGRQDSNQQFPGYSVLGRLIGGSVDSQSQKT